MRRVAILIIIVISLTDAFSQAQWDTVSVSPLEICLGDCVDPYSNGGNATILMNNDFNNGTIGAGWSSNSAQFDNPCNTTGTGNWDGTTYLWVGPASTFPRNLTTVAFDVTSSCQICFDFKMATQGDGSPCEGPDEMDEGVSLQWSTDGGTTWTDITYFCPDGTEYPTNAWIGQSTAGGGTSGPFIAWANYCYNVPTAAAGSNTQFQWHQEQVTDAGYDHWGIDNVFINCPSPNVSITWNDSNLGDFYWDANPPPQCPTQNTTYTATIDDGIGSDIETFDVIVYQPPTMDIQGLNPAYCLVQNAVTMIGLPAGGTFSGPGVSGNQFDPATAGLGTHTITYDWYQLDSHGDTLCSFSTTTSVIVNNGPTADFTVVTPLCAGTNTTVTYTGTGTSAANYSWNWGGLGAIPGTGQGPHTGTASAGTYTVSLQVTENGCTGSPVSHDIEFSELVSTIAGTNLLCFGDANGTIDVTITEGASPYTYTWSPNPSDTANLTGLSAGVYNVTVTDDNACINTLTYEVTQPPLLQINNEESTDILCFGDGNGTITVDVIGGTPDFTYDYGNGTQINNGLFTGLSGGSFIVTITDANGCSVISNQLTVIEPPILEFTSHQVQNLLCFGDDNGVISSTVIGGVGNYNFDLNSVIQNNGTYIDLGNGSYTMIVTDGNGCSITHDTIVTEPNKLVATIPEEIVICEGETADILASVSGGTSPYDYHWAHTSSNIDIVHESPVVDTKYYVYVTDINNCKSEVSACQVLVSPDVYLTSSSNRDSICPGEPVLITSLATEGNNNYTYYIDGNIVQSEEIIYPYQSHDYVVTVIDGCGKTATVIAPVFVYPVPPNNFYPDIMEGCQPLTVSFVETNTLDGQTFVWDFGDNSPENSGTSQNPVHIYEEDGIFDVSLTITSKDGCINTLQQSNLIHVYINPDAKFEANPEVISIINPTITFFNHSINADSYAWSFNDGDSSYVVSPVHSFSTSFIGDYEVVLIARTNKGCTDTVKNIITVREEFTFYAPTAFTPDGDGINDIFYVKGSGIDLDNFALYIYDRWGEIIFQSEDIYEGWDGRAKNHKKVQNGVFKWHVIYHDGYGIEHKETGNVTVIY